MPNIELTPAERAELLRRLVAGELPDSRGRFGPFLSCSGYPECRNIVNLKKNKEAPETEPPQLTDVACDKCGRPMAVKKGRYGPFLACTGYPDCKNIMKMNKYITFYHW